MEVKRIRTKGKIKLSNYFQKLEKNDRVAVVSEPSVQSGHPKRILGKCGKVVGIRGKFNLIEMPEGKKTKTFAIHSIHLKKLN